MTVTAADLRAPQRILAPDRHVIETPACIAKLTAIGIGCCRFSIACDPSCYRVQACIAIGRDAVARSGFQDAEHCGRTIYISTKERAARVSAARAAQPCAVHDDELLSDVHHRFD